MLLNARLSSRASIEVIGYIELNSKRLNKRNEELKQKIKEFEDETKR